MRILWQVASETVAKKKKEKRINLNKANKLISKRLALCL